MSRGARAEKRSQWRARLQRFAGCQLSVAEFCRRERVSVPSFYQWQRKLSGPSARDMARRGPTRADFVPVQVATGAELHVSFPNGARLTLPAADHEAVRLAIETIAQARTRQGDA